MNRPDPHLSRGRGWRILWHLVAPQKAWIGLLALVSLSSALLEAAFIVLLTSIGMALAGGTTELGPAFGRRLSLTTAIWLAGLALVGRVIFAVLNVRMAAGLSARVTGAQRRRLSHAYLRTTWAIQQSEPAGRLQELLTSFVAQVNNAIAALGTMITAALSLAALLGVGVAVDPFSTLAVLGALGVVGAALAPVRSAIRRRARVTARAGLEFSNAVAELGSLGQEMQTFGVEAQFERRIDSLTEQAVVAQRRTEELAGILPQLYMSLAYGAVLAGVAILSSSGTITNLAVVGAVLLLMLRSLSYGQQLSAVSGRMASYLPFLERLVETLDRYQDSPARSGARVPGGVAPLEIKDVSYRYVSDRSALEEVTFCLDRGEFMGIIGPSGSGKSTLAQLLLGLRMPTAGSLTAAGVPLAELDHEWWTKHVAFVPQEANLFTGTVAENIRFFREGITMEDLREAAQQANVLAEIEKLPRGFDTHLGERGSHLSGGQRQRLSIARALAGRPQLLVLDEPTSALDGQSEALVRETLRGLRGKLAVVIIAHRMSTLDVCDRIMVVQDGRLTALDTPANLRLTSDFYRQALAVAGIGEGN